MNKSTILWLVVIILIASAFIFSGKEEAPAEIKNSDAMMEDKKTDDSMMMEEDKMDGGDAMMEKAPEGSMMSSQGTYEVYSPEKVSAAGDDKIVLFFKATWCPTCRALDGNIKSNATSIPDDVTILEVDYDKNPELKQKYGVRTQHTLVQVDSSGNMVHSWLGSPTLSNLVSQIK